MTPTRTAEQRVPWSKETKASQKRSTLGSSERTSSRRKSRGLVIKESFRASVISQPSATASPARVGWLEKLASHGLWQKRFFVASGHYLRYFGDDACEELLAAVDVAGAALEPSGKRGFKLCRDDSSFAVRCASELERDDWVDVLQSMIDNDQQRKTSKTSESSKKKKTSKTEKQRLSSASSSSRLAVDPSAALAGTLLLRTHRDGDSSWQRRYFVAAKHCLKYYETDELGAPLLGCVDLNEAVVEHDDKSFTVSSPAAHLAVETSHRESAAQWFDTIRALQGHPGRDEEESDDDEEEESDDDDDDEDDDEDDDDDESSEDDDNFFEDVQVVETKEDQDDQDDDLQKPPPPPAARPDLADCCVCDFLNISS